MNLYQITYGERPTPDVVFIAAQSFAVAETVFLRWFPEDYNAIKSIDFVSDQFHIQEAPDDPKRP